jgi:hypothetical protein
MIYCANCKKPSARESGLCPHCGKDLEGKTRSVSKAPRVKTEGAMPGGEIDLGDDSSSGLELADDSYVPPIEGQAPAVSNEGLVPIDDEGKVLDVEPLEGMPELADVDSPAQKETPAPLLREGLVESEINRVSGFGKPGEGIVAGVKYWLKVRDRHRAILKDIEEANEESESSKNRLAVVRAELGKKGHSLGVATDSIKPLVSSALVADGEFMSIRKRRIGLESDHRDAVHALEQTIRDLEKEAADIRRDETVASLKLDGLKKDHRRVEGQQKRAQIEHRNLLEMIERLQEEYADLEKPKQERDKLLARISELDKQQPEIIERINAHGEDLKKIVVPLGQAEEEAKVVRDRLFEHNERITAIRTEKANLNEVFSQADNSVSRQIDVEKEQITAAWAAVGERMIAERLCDGDDLRDNAHVVKGAVEAAHDASRRVELLLRAMDAYDKGVFTKGRNVVIAGAIGVVAVIVVLLSVFVV